MELEFFLISLIIFVYCSSNPVYAGVYRGYDMAAFMDTNLPLAMGSVAILKMAPA